MVYDWNCAPVWHDERVTNYHKIKVSYLLKVLVQRLLRICNEAHDSETSVEEGPSFEGEIDEICNERRQEKFIGEPTWNPEVERQKFI